jgi:hypothetical protein
MSEEDPKIYTQKEFEDAINSERAKTAAALKIAELAVRNAINALRDASLWCAENDLECVHRTLLCALNDPSFQALGSNNRRGANIADLGTGEVVHNGEWHHRKGLHFTTSAVGARQFDLMDQTTWDVISREPNTNHLARALIEYHLVLGLYLHSTDRIPVSP